MASNTNVVLNPGAGGASMWVRSYQGVIGETGSVVAEVVNTVDGSGNVLDGSGRVQGAAVAPSSGVGGGTVLSAATGRVMTLRCYAVGADGTVAFHGGSLDGVTLTVRAGSGFDWTPATEQTCSTDIVFSASLDYFVEWA